MKDNYGIFRKSRRLNSSPTNWLRVLPTHQLDSLQSHSTLIAQVWYDPVLLWRMAARLPIPDHSQAGPFGAHPPPSLPCDGWPETYRTYARALFAAHFGYTSQIFDLIFSTLHITGTLENVGKWKSRKAESSSKRLGTIDRSCAICTRKTGFYDAGAAYVILFARLLCTFKVLTVNISVS